MIGRIPLNRGVGHRLAALVGGLGTTTLILGSLRVLVILGSAGWLLTAPLPVPDRRLPVYVLAAFAGYSLLLLALLLRSPGWIARIDRPVLLADLAVAFTLVSLTGGMQSELFPAFYLLTAIHSYCFGLARGLAVAGASALLCLLSGWPGVALADWPHCALRLAFLLLVASALGLLAEKDRRERRMVELLNRECEARADELKWAFTSLEQKERTLRLLLDKVVRAQEEERVRVARDLHDEIGQAASALMMRLEVVESLLLPDRPHLKKHLLDIKGVGADLLQGLRRLVADLRPPVLDDMGLVEAVRWQVERVGRGAPVTFSLEIDGNIGRLPAPIETALFRVVQEAIRNVVKHAEARQAVVRLGMRDSTVEVVIEDDGRGFTVTEAGVPANGKASFGLLGMRERVEMLGGSLKIDSSPGHGTRVRARIPIDKSEVGNGQAPDPDRG